MFPFCRFTVILLSEDKLIQVLAWLEISFYLCSTCLGGTNDTFLIPIGTQSIIFSIALLSTWSEVWSKVKPECLWPCTICIWQSKVLCQKQTTEFYLGNARGLLCILLSGCWMEHAHDKSFSVLY